MKYHTFLVGLGGGIEVRVRGKADNAELGELGEKIVTPGDGNLGGNEVHLQGGGKVGEDIVQGEWEQESEG